jgi:monoamine oxidase
MRQAAADLPLGLANKVFLKLDEPEMFAADSHLFGDPSRTETGSYALRPLGLPLVQGFLGGRCARELEREGQGAAAAFALEELTALLGSSFRVKAHPIAETRWAADPWSGGSYSHALPGLAGARATLARTFAGRIAFAGEACSPHAFSTAHGAAQSGREAADRILAALAVVPA